MDGQRHLYLPACCAEQLQVNPLGLTLVEFRADEAFDLEEATPTRGGFDVPLRS